MYVCMHSVLVKVFAYKPKQSRFELIEFILSDTQRATHEQETKQRD